MKSSELLELHNIEELFIGINPIAKIDLDQLEILCLNEELYNSNMSEAAKANDEWETSDCCVGDINGKNSGKCENCFCYVLGTNCYGYMNNEDIELIEPMKRNKINDLSNLKILIKTIERYRELLIKMREYEKIKILRTPVNTTRI